MASTAAIVLGIYIATIEYLEDLLEKPAGLAICEWILPIIVTNIIRLRNYIATLSPLEPMKQALQAILNATVSIAGSDSTIVDPGVGLVIFNQVLVNEPGACDPPVTS